MNVLIMSKFFEKSGVGTHIQELCVGLQKRGHNVYLISGTNRHSDFLRKNGIEHLDFDFSLSPIKVIKNIIILKKFIKERKINVVHSHYRTCSLYMALVNLIYRIPYVWSNHLNDIPSDFIHKHTTFYGKQAICVSTELKEFCNKKLGIPENKISVIFNGIHPEKYEVDQDYVSEFKKKHNLSQEKIMGLFARMDPVKGHMDLIKALAKIDKERLENIRVIFFGGGEEEYIGQLKSKIEEYELTPCIIFEGYVTPNQALSISDVTVLPSLNEGFGITCIESFMMKKPCIRTKTAGYRDMEEGCVGIEVSDIEALRYEVEKFIDGYDYSDIIETAYKMVFEKFTVDTMVDSILNLYNTVANK